MAAQRRLPKPCPSLGRLVEAGSRGSISAARAAEAIGLLPSERRTSVNESDPRQGRPTNVLPSPKIWKPLAVADKAPEREREPQHTGVFDMAKTPPPSRC